MTRAGEQSERWPFAFAAEQRFMLTPDALHVALTLRNLHRRAGAGRPWPAPVFSAQRSPHAAVQRHAQFG